MVPKGWEQKTFGDVVKLSKGKYDPKKSKDCFPCVELEHITQETGQLTGNVPASNLGSTKNKFNAGDVIFGKLRPYLRKYAQPNFDGVCSSEIWVFAPTKKIINPYLFQFIQTDKFITEANKSAGSKMPRADWGVVSEMLFSLPPLQEQRKIAAILSTWDKAISTTERLIDNSKQQKKALMQQLLTGKKRLLDDSGRPFEGEWEWCSLDKVSDVKGGKRLPKGHSLTEIPNSHPYIRVADMFMGGVEVQNILYVPEEIASFIKNYTIGKDDLFITVAGTLGIVGEIPHLLDGANLTENADKLTNITCNKKFLLYVLKSPIIQRYVDAESTQNAQPKLALVRIRSFKIPLPTPEEQQKIAAALSNADKEIELLGQQLADLKQEKKALMQQLLTGKRRVEVNDEAVA